MSTLMFVDDSEDMRKLYRRLSKGHNALVFKNPQEAIEHLQQSSEVDLIICDWEMGPFRGDQLYNWLKEHHPELMQKFYFCTGSPEDVIKTVGITSLVEKPNVEALKVILTMHTTPAV